MSLLEVHEPGLLTTVQDLGREGFGALGVSASGAADPIALRLGNRLAGNPDNAAALEMTLLGGAFHFPEGARAALSGADFGATLERTPVEPWSSFEIGPGQTLRLGATRSGARCYLCVQGGIAVNLFLGSASTHLLSGLGGFEGRALKRGDALQIAAADKRFARRTIAPLALQRLLPRSILRVTEGPQSDWFPAASKSAFYGELFRVAEQSNRVGLRLVGAPVPASSDKEMITEGVALGAVQVPPGGQPIIVFVEQQTTGGYPKIANVISADLPSLGQLRPRDEVRFERVSLETARLLLREQQEMLSSEGLISERR